MSDAKETAGWGWSDAKESSSGGWGCLILLCFVGFAIYGGYQWLDSIGWIAHREEAVISARSDWLVGESKECLSATLTSDGATLLGKKVGYAMSSVSCDDGPEHKMKVTFYGQKVQTEETVVSWRCTRNEVSFLNDNSFTCYQTGGQPKFGQTEWDRALSAASHAHNLDADLLACVLKADNEGDVQAINHTASHLNDLLIRYHDNIALALAAYHSGPDDVDKYQGIPPDHETRVYVARVIHEFNNRVKLREGAIQR